MSSPFKPRPWPACLSVLLSCLLGCQEDSRPAPSSTVRDSAGVQIVENYDGPPASAELWSLTEEPVLEVGAVEGASDYELYRVQSGLILGTRAIAITNGGSQEIRYYEFDGGHLGSHGGRGRGPGEYMGVGGVWRYPGDSLLVWDQALRRASMVTPDRQFARTVDLRGDFTNHRVGGVFADGTILIIDGRVDDEPTGDWQQLRSTLTRFAPTGEPLDTIGRFPWFEMKFSLPFRGEGVRLGFDLSAQYAVLGDRVWVGPTKAYELLEFTVDGILARIIRWTGPDRAVMEEDKDLYLEDRLARADDDETRRRIRMDHEQRVFADSFPAYSQILVDDQRRLWVQDYRRPGTVGPNRWLIFEAHGAPIATMYTDPSLRPLDVSGGLLLAVVADPLGVEFLRVFEIDVG